MSRHPDQGAIAAVQQVTNMLHQAEAGPSDQVTARLIAAEAVASCAYHLVMQWAAWDTLNRSAIATLGTSSQADAMSALVAYELVDAAVHAWAPHIHPAIGAAARSLADEVREAEA